MKIELGVAEWKRLEMIAGTKSHQIIQYLKSLEVKRAPKSKQAQSSAEAT